MLIIQQITDNPLQKTALVLPDGSQINLEIYFRSMQAGWFINTLTYGDFTLHGVRITNSPNFLYQWKNVLPFGLACFSTQNREPTQQQDFSSGASKLYVVTSDEVKQYEAFLSGG